MISARCPNCGRDYQVKDEFAGKKFRCKDCEAAVSVPAGGAPRGASARPSGSATRSPARSRTRSLDEGLDDLRRADEDDYGYDDYDDEPVLRPQRPPKQSSKSSKKSRSSGSGSMPGPVIAFLVIEALAFLKNGAIMILVGIGILASFSSPDGPLKPILMGLVVALALLCNVGISVGTFKGAAAARIGGIVLSSLAAVIILVLFGFALIGGVGAVAMLASGSTRGDADQARQAGAMAGAGLAMICFSMPYLIALALYVAQVVLLLRPSSARYFR